MERAIEFILNGQKRSISSDPDTPLLYVLRNQFVLNSPKYGCGLGQCGSCMVLVDGQSRYSCLLPVAQMEGKQVQTLENIDAGLDAIREAFFEMQAAQCGYCTNGMIMATKALLNANPRPDTSAIKTALNPVLCRCGTHSRIIDAVKLAAEKLRKGGQP